MVDLGVDILEALQLKQVLLTLLVPDVLRLNELFGLDLSLGVTDLYVIALRLAHLFIVLQTLVSVLQVPARRFSEVVTDNTFDRCLWSIWTSKCELFIGQRNLISTILQRAHAEWHPSIVAFSVNIVLWCGHISIDNCSVIEQFEISYVVRLLIVLGSVHLPGCAYLGGALLGLLVRSAIREVVAWKSARSWL